MADKPSENTQKLLKSFIFSISFIIVLISVAAIAGIFLRQKQLFDQELKSRAQAHFESIILTRKWNASYGGVYVEKRLGVVSNPYLKDPDIKTTDGKTYTLKNPALMNREISEYASEEDLYSFHITSLKSINPNNKPDYFERLALTNFESGEKESIIKEKEGSSVYYRYMAPLITDISCLSCHAEQGYKVGDVRGGISIKFDISDSEKALTTGLLLLIVVSCVALIVLISIFYTFTRNLRAKLNNAQERIRAMAITDELTNLYNRNHFFERFSDEFNRSTRHGHFLSCIKLEVDHFKATNDIYGHAACDQLLQGVADVLRFNIRETDVLARYGNEEFVVILPETNLTGALFLAEKIRLRIEKLQIELENLAPLKVNSSSGVSCLDPKDEQRPKTIGELIKMADDALSYAKSKGGNQVSSQRGD
jgi:diguanylate cyclase (GGDEF)-like protein